VETPEGGEWTVETPRDFWYVFTALHRDEADFKKNKAPGWQQDMAIGFDQFAEHVLAIKQY
jgi:hypothetical protein